MCGTDVGASLSSHTKLKATAKTKKTAYVGHDAGSIHAADARESPTPAAATLARTAVVRPAGRVSMPLPPTRREETERAELVPQTLAGDAEAPGGLLPAIAVRP